MEGAQLLGGRYVLLDKIGVGGMAVVWHARDEVLGRPVAVKVLAGKHAGEPEARERIHAEARAAAALSHPNIAQVYDYGADDGSMPYVVMELVRGGTLQDRMDAGPMSPRFAMRLAAEVAAALAAAHSDGLVHRDIKPANVMVTPAGAKVVDFGIAAAIDPGGVGDDDFEVFGTPAYLAPERLTGDGVEPASDVYALGVLLYRMLSGHSPWTADTTTQMLTAHIYVDPQPLPDCPGVPGYITALCNRCLAKDPTERPSAREAAALLAQGAGLRVVEDAAPAGPAGAGPGIEPSVLIRPRSATAPDVVPAAVFTAPAGTAGPVASPVTAQSRRGRLVAAAAAVVAVVLAGGGLLWWQVGADGDAGQSRAAPIFGDAPVASPSAAAVPSAAGPSPAAGSPSPGSRSRTAPAGGGGPRRTPAATAPGAGAPATTRPPAEPKPTRTSPPPADPPAQERTLTSAAGSVRATCPGASTAQLLSASASTPFKVKKVDPGPAASVVAVFKHGNDRIRMIVTCSGGVPSSRVKEN